VAGPGRREWIRGGRTDLTRDVIAEAADTSLARLQIDCIDVFQIHWPQRNVPMFGETEFDRSKERPGPAIREQVEGMAALIKAGKIRYYGLSNETAWGVCEFRRVARELGVPGPVTIQNSYSLLSRGVDNDLAEALFRERCRCSPTVRWREACCRESIGAARDHPKAASRCSTTSACAFASRTLRLRSTPTRPSPTSLA
jgi:aryl-alcohol dehydrogenase-like predicted oxidoreductase